MTTRSKTNETGTKHQSDIRIYAACLASYNNGILHGAWINADQDADDIRTEISATLEASPIHEAEEYAIHDYEGFEGVSLPEYCGVDEIAALAAFITEHGRLGAAVYAHYGDIEDAKTALSEHYHGQFRSLAEFAEQLTEEMTEVPESLRFYIDYEAMARDLEINDVLTIETGFDAVHVFWRH